MNRISPSAVRAEAGPPLVFRPVDLDAHLQTCVDFRIDTCVCGFGSAERFHERDGLGAERYADWLRTRAERMPGCLVHLWQGDTIIGQIEMGRTPSDPAIGYVNLFYLRAHARGRGLGRLLEAYAWTYLSGLGCQSIRLSASPTNTPAWHFYRKQGWQDLGPREDDPKVHLLEKREAIAQPALVPIAAWTHAQPRSLRVPFSLRTERVALIPAQAPLAQPLADALNASFELHRDFLPWSQPHWTRQQAQQSLEGAARDYFLSAGEKRYFVITGREPADIVGCIGLTPGCDETDPFELGYWANQRHAGKGLMSEALAALVAALKGHSLYLTTSSANQASQRLAEAVGLRQVKVIVGDRQSEKFGICDTLVYRRDREAFENG
ncbi:GNAT family N-acetyltransferase [Pseudomonas sp. S75]|uniref:GNAT family N-acetyltransferase n=1 Tax=unclassified Pseudomonas TaxID=196821 RepID=UPI00190AF746|nr:MULTISPECIES: GNAT family N-acetyltransferase [unclassified Pseudomonas]MBK0152983.1 GNAT family N-acetyltransferase [Pseudomonas sp. S75]